MILVNHGTPYGEQGRGHIRIVTACFASDAYAQVHFARMRAALMAMAAERGLC